MNKLRYTAHFKRDFHRGTARGCDPGKTVLSVLLLAAAFFLGSNLAGRTMQQKVSKQVKE